MNPDILMIGDLHCRQSHLEEFELVKKEIIRHIDVLHPKNICFSGDLFHNHNIMHVDVFNSLFNFFVEISQRAIRTIILVGNHDYRNNSEIFTKNHSLNAFRSDYIRVVDRPTDIYISARRCLFVPYLPAGQFFSQLADKWSVEELNSNFEAIFCHQEFKGADFGSILSENGDDIGKLQIPVFSGHIHERQQIGNCHYVGTPYMTTFGESEDKSIAAIKFGDNEILGSNILMRNIPKKITIISNVNDVEDVLLQINQTDQYRLIIKDTVQNIQAFKKSNIFDKYQKQVKFIFDASDASLLEVQTQKQNYLSILNELCEQNGLSDVLMEIVK